MVALPSRCACVAHAALLHLQERVQPKMGKIDIDYQVLHDAFFKYQTKPVLTGHGDVYYEGKEFEVAPLGLG